MQRPNPHREAYIQEITKMCLWVKGQGHGLDNALKRT
jgi:hypothetical protein